MHLNSWREKIAIRYFLETVALCFLLAIGIGFLYAYVQSETRSQIIRLGFGFFSVLAMGACLGAHAHFVLIRPLHRLSQNLQSLDFHALISEDIVVMNSSDLQHEFSAIESEFHALLGKVHHRHREVLRTRQNLAHVSARFHENKLNALGEMAAGIAHEINNPLAILVGRLEQFRELMKTSEISGKMEAIILSMEKTVFRIQDAVADLELIASSPSAEEIRKINLGRLLTRVVKVARNRYQLQEIRFETDLSSLSGLDLDIEAREVELSQALLYLLENAAEAAEKEKEAWVRIELTYIESKSQFVILIQDSGLGLEKSLRSNLFQPFFTTKSEGRGMGLSLAKSVIDGHKGRIAFDFDRPNTTVKINLPIRQRQSSAA